MTPSWRSALVMVIGAALTGIALGAVMGVVWWLVTPTEQWIKVEGGLGAAQISSPSWFAADGWFLIIGVVAGLVLAGVTWTWARRHPFSLLVGVLLGAVLLSLVAWSVGGVIGPPDPATAAASLAIGDQVDGSLGLRALGVLAAPPIAALALLALLLATVSVSGGNAGTEETRSDVPSAPHDDWVPQQPFVGGAS